jgi:hypothetical protein
VLERPAVLCTVGNVHLHDLKMRHICPFKAVLAAYRVEIYGFGEGLLDVI